MPAMELQLAMAVATAGTRYHRYVKTPLLPLLLVGWFAQIAPAIAIGAVENTNEALTIAADAAFATPSAASPPVAEILMQALSMVGVKYRFGGTSIERGFDCSGYVRFVFNQSIAMTLPRSSYEMSLLGDTIERDALEPGDLIFYNTLRRRFSHVAIYLGDGRFIHAPSRGKQVEIVDMSDRYWLARFDGARRLLGSKPKSE